MTNNELINAFREARYFIQNSGIYIVLDDVNAELDDILDEYNVSEWVLITAWNPGGFRITVDNNQNRQIELLQDLEDYKILDARGESPDHSWYEDGFLVLGLDMKKGSELAIKYGQKAILYGRIGHNAELIIID
ncbi:MAG TPA: DUF3293 domain-containing protein [Saprospiraceae bacterium]|nr:DUF3293 domain-containing protein [Saprospiraceae bacterium]